MTSGLLREPKYGHLKDLHKAIKRCEHALVSSDPTVTSLGTYEQVSFLWYKSTTFYFQVAYFFKVTTAFKVTTMIHVLVIFQAHVFNSGTGTCAAFLANYHSNSAARVTFNNRHYDLPPWSISILPDCRTDVFNTARVRIYSKGPFVFSWFKCDRSSCCVPSVPFGIKLLIELLCFHEGEVPNFTDTNAP